MLPHSLLERYFADIEGAVAQLPAYAESHVEEILTSERANLRIRLRFQNGCPFTKAAFASTASKCSNNDFPDSGYTWHWK